MYSVTATDGKSKVGRTFLYFIFALQLFTLRWLAFKHLQDVSNCKCKSECILAASQWIVSEQKNKRQPKIAASIFVHLDLGFR